MDLKQRSLQLILTAYGTEGTRQVLSEFVCEANLEVQDFIRNKAIDHEKRRLAKTMLIFDKDANMQLVGFYSITTKSLEINKNLNTTQKKHFFGTSQTSGDTIPSILIGQLGKNEAVRSDFTGTNLMELIFSYIYMADKYLPSVVTYVEHDGRQSLIDYYEKNGFMYYQRKEEEKNKHLFCHLIRTQRIIDMLDMEE